MDKTTASPEDNSQAARPADAAAQPARVPGIEYVELDTPIRRGSQEIAEVGLRKPKAGELRGLSLQALAELDVATLQKLLPRITVPSITQVEADGLDLPDLAAFATKVGTFLLRRAERESLGL